MKKKKRKSPLGRGQHCYLMRFPLRRWKSVKASAEREGVHLSKWILEACRKEAIRQDVNKNHLLRKHRAAKLDP